MMVGLQVLYRAGLKNQVELSENLCSEVIFVSLSEGVMVAPCLDFSGSPAFFIYMPELYGMIARNHDYDES